jgi:hypothetical protein
MGSQSNFPSKKEIIMYGLWTIYTKIETQDPAFVFSAIHVSQYFQYSYQNQGNEMGEVSMAGRRGILIAIAKVF